MNSKLTLTKTIEGYRIGKIADGYSPDTIRSYESRLYHLARYLGDVDVVNISSNHLKDFIYYLRTNYRPVRPSGDVSPLTEAAIHGYWKAMRSMWNWLNDEFDLEPIAKSLKMPVYSNKPISPFTKDEIRRMIEACEYTSHARTNTRKPYKWLRKTAHRDRSLLLIFLDSGIRLGECSRLKLNDVKLENGQLKVVSYGRGRKTKGRIVIIGSATRRSLWKYMSQRQQLYDSENLFLNRYNQPLGCGAIKSMVRRIGEKCGINAYPHRFRHTFAIEFLRNGGDIYTLKELLGHSTLEMVKRYLAIAEVDKVMAHKRASPVDRWGL